MDRSYVAFDFFVFLHPLENELHLNPPSPQNFLPLNPPSPSEFPMTFCWGGGGVWIFSETTYYIATSYIMKNSKTTLLYRLSTNCNSCKEQLSSTDCLLTVIQ